MLNRLWCGLGPLSIQHVVVILSVRTILRDGHCVLLLHSVQLELCCRSFAEVVGIAAEAAGIVVEVGSCTGAI